MKKFGKLLALLLTAVMAMSALCVSSSAASSAYVNAEDVSATLGEFTNRDAVKFTVNKTGETFTAQCYKFRGHTGGHPAEEYMVKFDLNKKYSYFIGNVALDGSYEELSFYGDGKLIKKMTTTLGKNENWDFNINVTKVKELKVVAKCGASYIYSCKFQKNSLKISDSELKLDVKGSATLKVTYKDGAGKAITGKKVKYASKDKKIAKVSSKGKIVGVSAGVTKVTVTSPDGLAETCKVIVLPKKVTGVKLASASSDSVKLQWDKVDGADSYEVGFYDPDLEEYEKLKSVSGTTANIKDLDSNTEYTFMVRACIKDGSKVYKGAFSDDFKTKTTK